MKPAPKKVRERKVKAAVEKIFAEYIEKLRDQIEMDMFLYGGFVTKNGVRVDPLSVPKIIRTKKKA